MWRDCALATNSPHGDWQRQQIATHIGEDIFRLRPRRTNDHIGSCAGFHELSASVARSRGTPIHAASIPQSGKLEPHVTATLSRLRALRFQPPGKHESRGISRLWTGWETGAGEGIRTLDPNLGKQKITPSRYSIRISQISFPYARGCVLPVFAELAICERNDTPMN